MALFIKEVTEENWRAIAALAVSEGQQVNIESNHQSLLEAAYDTSLHWQPLGLYRDQALVGFAMIGAENQTEKSIWLDRLMIDHRYQGQGLGRQFLQELLTYINTTRSITTVYLSIHQGNDVAARLYESIGFKDLHKTDPANREWIYMYSYQ